MRDETQDALTTCPRCGSKVPWEDNPSNPVNWPQWGGKDVKHKCLHDPDEGVGEIPPKGSGKAE